MTEEELTALTHRVNAQRIREKDEMDRFNRGFGSGASSGRARTPRIPRTMPRPRRRR